MCRLQSASLASATGAACHAYRTLISQHGARVPAWVIARNKWIELQLQRWRNASLRRNTCSSWWDGAVGGHQYPCNGTHATALFAALRSRELAGKNDICSEPLPQPAERLRRPSAAALEASRDPSVDAFVRSFLGVGVGHASLMESVRRCASASASIVVLPHVSSPGRPSTLHGSFAKLGARYFSLFEPPSDWSDRTPLQCGEVRPLLIALVKRPPNASALTRSSMRSVLLRGEGGRRLGALGQLELWPSSVVSSAPDVSHNFGVTLVHSGLVGVGG